MFCVSHKSQVTSRNRVPCGPVFCVSHESRVASHKSQVATGFLVARHSVAPPGLGNSYAHTPHGLRRGVQIYRPSGADTKQSCGLVASRPTNINTPHHILSLGGVKKKRRKKKQQPPHHILSLGGERDEKAACGNVARSPSAGNDLFHSRGRLCYICNSGPDIPVWQLLIKTGPDASGSTTTMAR